ncbi:MAG TPA: NlpC/P60 family protein [Micromonosporaceae bacterium]
MRSVLSVLVLSASLVIVGGLHVTAANASPANPSDQSVSSLISQINKQWNALEPTIENFDAVSQKLATQQAKANKLQAAIQPLALQVQVARSLLAPVAAHLYESGPTDPLTILLNSASAGQALDLIATVDRMQAHRNAQVAATAALEQKYETQKAPIDALVASLTQQRTVLASQKAKINAAIQSLDVLRRKAWGTTVSPGPLKPVACPQVYNGDAGSRAALWACNQIGKPYVFGAAGPNSFDCSGLTMQAWASVGVSLPHNAYQQKHSMPSVSYANLQPGDLVFYFASISHVTIYVGNGWVVSAPSTGDRVRMKRYNEITPVGYGRPNG